MENGGILSGFLKLNMRVEGHFTEEYAIKPTLITGYFHEWERKGIIRSKLQVLSFS